MKNRIEELPKCLGCGETVSTMKTKRCRKCRWTTQERERHSKQQTGRTPWNKGKKIKGHPISLETRKKIGEANRGNKSPFKGVPRPKEVRDKISKAHMGVPRPNRRGENCHLWKGGVTAKNKAIRSSLKYQVWRREVFERDDYTCQICCKRGVTLHADHIKPFAHYPELRFELSNGRTLCVDCHKQTETYLYKNLFV